MIQSLTIKNYALISRLEIDFPGGFSAITGETGAGKSIILGALSLILGQRADSKSIKQGESKCLIEGVFDITAYSLQAFFEERELDYDPSGHCILRREIWNNGKSRAFINDSPVGLNDLKELGNHLIDIHSQHQNLLLADNRFQLQVLDILANNKDLRQEYSDKYKAFSSVASQLRALKDKAGKDAKEEDFLRFQYQELQEAKLEEGEQADLENELQVLSHLEEIKTGLYKIEENLSNDEQGIIPALKESLNTIQSLETVYDKAGSFSERIESAYIELKDLYTEISSQQEKLEFDPDRLSFVSERLNMIYSLQHKHRVDSVSALIGLQEGMKLQLNAIDNYDDELLKLQKELDALNEQVNQLASKLSSTRKQAATGLQKELIRKVNILGMPNMQFDTGFNIKPQPDASGRDEVEFMFSATKNNELKPVAQIASGGEIARIMLGIKALIAGATALPTILFDEIDTGVSGEIADKMGKIMAEMSKNMQVIAITHLPQIAAQGGTQFFVYKEENQATTETHIRELNQEERIKETARMLSGAELTPAAIENAKALLNIK